MPKRSRAWTIVVVPHGSDSPRNYEITERGLRLMAWAGGMVVLLAAGGVAFAAAHLTTVPSVLLLATPANRQLADMRTHVADLRDTLAQIAKRDAQIRLLAGLPRQDSDSLVATAPLNVDVDGLITEANTLSASFANVSTTLLRNSQRLESTPSIMPTAGWLSSEFSKARFHPILHTTRPHEGIDVAAPYGAPVVAPAAGVVERITNQTGYGLVLEIDHGNGIETKYAHLSAVKVRYGQRVVRGQPIAAVGNSGLSTGPHLHYEIHVDSKVVDPLTYVLPGADPD
jgi:murein DD-endopeptidase MepM/ murein hydrolase activator NlpD